MSPYEVKKQTEEDGEYLIVHKDGEVCFKMALRYNLVFATIADNQLYVYEDTPYSTVSSAVNLLTNQAVSQSYQNSNPTVTTEWSYDLENDAWILK